MVFTLFEDFVSAANPFHWLTVVGLLLIATVLFAPKGLYGTAADWIARRRPAHERAGHARPRLRGRPSGEEFRGLRVTNDVSLSLRPGDRMALIGPNGAGKTTFVNLVTGALKADAGEVRLDGESVNRLDPIGRVRRGLVRSFQVTRLFLR